jgi:hypothetical protein
MSRPVAVLAKALSGEEYPTKGCIVRCVGERHVSTFPGVLLVNAWITKKRCYLFIPCPQLLGKNTLHRSAIVPRLMEC